jgi:type I restriction enzyme S subunit
VSFPKYPKYKKCVVDWLSEVPEHWEVRRLKSLVEEPLKYGANESAELDDRSLPRFVRITDIDDDGGLRDSTFKSLPTEVAEPYLLKEGDVLLARSGATVGKSFIYSKQWGTACFAGYLIRARLRNSLCMPTWLYYFCQTDGYWGYVIGSQIQATIQNVSAEKYANLFLPLPPRQEQSIVTSFLDRETSKIDKLVAEQRRLIELLKEKRQAIISHAVTKGLNPYAPMKPSGIEWLGDIPLHWEVTKLSRLATQIGDGLHGTPEYVDESEFRFINGNNLVDGFIAITDGTRCVSKDEFIRHQVPLNAGTLLLSINGTVGNLALFRGESVMLGKSAAYINCCDPLSRQFLFWWMQSAFMKRYFAFAVTGTTIFNLSLASVRSLPIPLPPQSEQLEIINTLDTQTRQYDDLLQEAERAIELLQERRTALISAAVTGKIDVRDFSNAEAA